MLKILNLSTNAHGGAGSASLRINKALNKNNQIDSILFTKTTRTNIDENKIFSLSNISSNFFQKVLSTIVRKFLFKEKYLMYGAMPSSNFYNIKIKLEELCFQPDIIILHWISNFISYEELISLKNYYPDTKFYWFLMDMSPITGGCHYAWSCDGYKYECNECPAAKNVIGTEIVKKGFQDKKKLFDKLQCQLISPNIFVSNQANSSPLISSKSAVNYIPIDQDIFFPNQVSDSSFTILFGGSNLHDYRKGGDLFNLVLRKLDQLLIIEDLNFQVFVMVPGLMHDAYETYQNIKIAEVPRASNETELRNLYKKSDVFVCCSREDSGPMMVSEAMMSGLTVVSFEVGIINELISDKLNGIIVKDYDVKKMAYEIFNIILNRSDKTLGEQARLKALTSITPDKFVERFLKLYHEDIHNNN